MSDYSAPTVLEHNEIATLLDYTLGYGETAHGRLLALRDHTIYDLALATGLRSHELSALTIGIMFDAHGRARTEVTITIYKGCERFNHKPRTLHIAATTRETLEHYYRLKHAAGEPLEAGAPLFLSQKGNAISTRQMRRMFDTWQARAGLTQDRSFHAFRHTACTNVYEASGNDIKATQVFAGHLDMKTTSRYVHARKRVVASAVDRAAASWASARKRSKR
jgi:integrase/recombinase XerC